jgi:hypothetical protein
VGATVTVDEVFTALLDKVAGTPTDQFYARQREVANQRSLVFDHTSYWKSSDDFVAWVADDLLTSARTPLEDIDRDWLDSASIRRDWRCSFLAACRAVAVAAAVTPAVSPALRHGAAAWAAQDSFPRGLASVLPAWAGRPMVLGPSLAVLAVWFLYLVAAAGWRGWDAREQRAFFNGALSDTQFRYPKKLIAGWGAIVVLTLAALIASEWPITWPSLALWPGILMIAITAFAVVRASNGAGTSHALRDRVRSRGKATEQDAPAAAKI